MPFAPYEPANSCRNAGPGAAALMYWLDKESPWAKTLGNYGVCNCRLPSIHSECRAGDSSVPVVKGGHEVGHELVRFLTECGLQLGVMETIFARRRRSANHPDGVEYTGPSPHWDHVHWALSRKACKNLNVPTIRAVYAAWVAGRPGGKPSIPAPDPGPGPTPAPTPTTPQEDDDVARLIRCNDKAHKEFGAVWAIAGLSRTRVTAQDYNRWLFLTGGEEEQAQLDGATFDFFMRNYDDITNNGGIRLTVLYIRSVVDQIAANVAKMVPTMTAIQGGVAAVQGAVNKLLGHFKIK